MIHGNLLLGSIKSGACRYSIVAPKRSIRKGLIGVEKLTCCLEVLKRFQINSSTVNIAFSKRAP